jgi:predicted P-loop ATPase
MAMKPPPWLRSQDNAWTPKPWTDHEDTLTTDWLQQQGIAVPITITASAVEAVAKAAAFHPVRDYLAGLVWDGTERVTTFATTHLGAEATAYHNEVSRRMLVAAVARIMRPGCKHDHMPILEAPQGAGKSKAIAALFQPWFTDDLAELGTKDASMQVRAAWGIEVAELSAMTRGEIERVKAFITRSTDRFRPSYGRRVIEVPRQSVFIGTTNALEYLKDETGGRRFWPIRCGTIDHSAIERDRDQLWAEAVALFNSGEPWWFTNAEILEQAHEQQSLRYQDDPWQPEVGKYCASVGDASIGEILEALGVERARWTQADQNRVARCLRQLGWERYRPWTTVRPRPWRYRPARPSPTQSTGTHGNPQ